MTVASLAVLDFYRIFTALKCRHTNIAFTIYAFNYTSQSVPSRYDTFLIGQLTPTDNSACTSQANVFVFRYEANGLSCGWKTGRVATPLSDIEASKRRGAYTCIYKNLYIPVNSIAFFKRSKARLLEKLAAS